MKSACWTLFALSAVLFVLGTMSYFGQQARLGGLAAGTYWKGAMGVLAYAATLRLLSLEERRTA